MRIGTGAAAPLHPFGLRGATLGPGIALVGRMLARRGLGRYREEFAAVCFFYLSTGAQWISLGGSQEN